MDLFSTATPFSASLAVLVGLAGLTIMLIVEVRRLIDKPALIRPTLYTYAAGLAFIALIAGWLALQLSFSVCQPIPSTTIDSVVEQLDRQPIAEAAK